jgi:hypothetical protein
MSFDFPASPTIGMQYVAPNGFVYLYDSNSSWTTKGDTQTSNPFSKSFKYRTIYTRGYTAGGYKDSSPWKNINRTQHATDITTNLGDMMDYAASYKTGGFSDYHLYVYGESDTSGAAATYVGSFNMSTEANRTHSTSWDMKYSRTDAEAIMNPSLTIAYICGGAQTAVDKHNLVTDTMCVAGTGGTSLYGGTGGGLAVIFGEFKGWVSIGSSDSSKYINFSTETWILDYWFTQSDGQPKGLSSKHGYGYCSNGSYAGTATLYKYNDISGGVIVASVSRPESAGEENWQIGQNWGYSLGCYNGVAQTNNSTKVNYLTDTCVAMGSDTQPKGHNGMSSGCCGTASSLILGGL